MERIYIGLDVGGTMIKQVVLDANNQVLEKRQMPTEDSAKNDGKWKQNIIDLIDNLSGQFSEDKDLIWGIAFPGLADKDNLKIFHMPQRLQGLEGYNWSAHFKRKIYVINDAHAATISEYETFYKSRITNMLMITLGTGVGGGVIINGELYQGHMERAGHFGHMTVDHQGPQTMTNTVGSLEYAIGNFSVAERTFQQYKSTKELVEAYEQGEALASYWWLNSIHKLACGISSLINAFSPQSIVLGGGITNAGASLFKPLKEFISIYEWKPAGKNIEIHQSRNGVYAGAIGAALFAKNKSKSDNL